MGKFLPFEEALAVARSLELATRREWQAWCKEGMCPANVPRGPDQVYTDGGWQGWGHWLGTGNKVGGAKNFLPYAEALHVAHCLRLKNRKEWEAWCRSGARPVNVPASPDQVYVHGGWQGWGHWLDTGNIRKGTEQFLPFDEARRVARQLRLVSENEWRLWCRTGARPANVPAAPDKVYVHDGWMGWTHWLYHANLDAAVAADEVPQPTRKRGTASASKGVAGSRAGKRQRR